MEEKFFVPALDEEFLVSTAQPCCRNFIVYPVAIDVLLPVPVRHFVRNQFEQKQDWNPFSKYRKSLQRMDVETKSMTVEWYTSLLVEMTVPSVKFRYGTVMCIT